MGFETPLALLGLLGALVPPLLHLIRQRRLPVVKFAPVSLLLEAAQQNQRRSRLTDLVPKTSTNNLSSTVLLLAAAGLVALLFASGSFVSVASRISRGQLR